MAYSKIEYCHKHYKSYTVCLTAKIRGVPTGPVFVFAHSYSLDIGANMISRELETVANKLQTPHWRRW